MKKHLIFSSLAFICLVTFTTMSCSNDDDLSSESGSVGNKSMIYGSWREVACESYKNEVCVRKDKYDYEYYCYAFRKDGSLLRWPNWDPDRVSTGGTFDWESNNQISLGWYAYGSWEERSKNTILKLTDDSLVWREPYPDTEYDYQICHFSRISSEYDDPFNETIVDSYSGNVKQIVSKYTDIRPFVGCWTTNNTDYYHFFSDKTSGYYDNKHSNNTSGIWNYNSDTQLFGMTNPATTWQIVVVGIDAWSYINLSSNKTIAFNRSTNCGSGKYFKDPNRELLVGEWKKTDGTDAVIYFDEKYNYKYKYDGHGRVISGSGSLDADLKFESCQILSIAGMVIEISNSNGENKDLAGTYIFQEK